MAHSTSDATEWPGHDVGKTLMRVHARHRRATRAPPRRRALLGARSAATGTVPAPVPVPVPVPVPTVPPPGSGPVLVPVPVGPVPVPHRYTIDTVIGTYRGALKLRSRSAVFPVFVCFGLNDGNDTSKAERHGRCASCRCATRRSEEADAIVDVHAHVHVHLLN